MMPLMTRRSSALGGDGDEAGKANSVVIRQYHEGDFRIL
jgi:hypothetical protein